MVHISSPTEPYNNVLPDHNWHNDLTFDQLPAWIKGNSKYTNLLLSGEQVVGKNVRYQIKHDKLIRRLRNHIIPVIQQGKNKDKKDEYYNKEINIMSSYSKAEFNTTLESGGGSRLTGSKDAKEKHFKYQKELNNRNAALINQVHHTEKENRERALEYFNQAQAFKADIKANQGERTALVKTLDAQIEKERGQEYQMWKLKQQGLNITASELPRGEFVQAGLGLAGALAPAPALKYLEEYPKSAATSFISDIINRIQQKEREIRVKQESFDRAVAGFNKELPLYEQNILKCQDKLNSYRKILEEGTREINNCRYVKGMFFRMLTQKQKDEILLQTLTHNTEQWEHMLELFKSDLSQWKKQPFTELTYSQT